MLCVVAVHLHHLCTPMLVVVVVVVVAVVVVVVVVVVDVVKEIVVGTARKAENA